MDRPTYYEVLSLSIALEKQLGWYENSNISAYLCVGLITFLTIRFCKLLLIYANIFS